MQVLAERVYRTTHRYSLLPPGARVVVALSGGADSTALACLLVDLCDRTDSELVAAAHFNHHLRGADSDADETFCRELAGRLGVGFRTGGADVAAEAHVLGRSIEDTARELRYRYLEQVMADLEATHLAVGHTRDDQAETVVLQMLRGAGGSGRRGMVPARPLSAEAAPPLSGATGPTVKRSCVLIRPLLEVGHADLVEWLTEQGVSFREDPSNRDPRYLRNRVRHELMPFLERRFSRSASRVLARGGAIAAAEDDYLNECAVLSFARIATVDGRRVVLDRAGLLAEPLAIGRRVVRLALGNLPAARFVGFDQGERLLELAAGRRQRAVALPGARARIDGQQLVLEAAAATVRRERSPSKSGVLNSFRSALSIPGEVPVGGTRWIVSSSLRPRSAVDAFPVPPEGPRAVAAAAVDASRVTELGVRMRRPGDRFTPLGLAGRKKLQDYFVDRKVPRDERDRVPLVVDGNDRIVWVAGHAIDEAFRVSAGTDAVVILELRGESA